MRNPKFAIRPVQRSFRIRRNRAQPSRHGSTIPAAAYRNDRHTGIRSVHGHSTPTAPDPITLAAATWLACGIVLLGLTPLPLRDAALGWSPAFWGLAAPLIVLLTRHPRVALTAWRSAPRRPRH